MQGLKYMPSLSSDLIALTEVGGGASIQRRMANILPSRMHLMYQEINQVAKLL